MMRTVFLDTSGLLALLSTSDAHHADATEVEKEIRMSRTGVVTTDFVLTELLASCARGTLRPMAVKAVQRLRASRATEVVESSRILWDAAFNLYSDRTDKAWSLADCASILLCQQRGIRDVLTHDAHFAQAGMHVLLR